VAESLVPLSGAGGTASRYSCSHLILELIRKTAMLWETVRPASSSRRNSEPVSRTSWLRRDLQEILILKQRDTITARPSEVSVVEEIRNLLTRESTQVTGEKPAARLRAVYLPRNNWQ